MNKISLSLIMTAFAVLLTKPALAEGYVGVSVGENPGANDLPQYNAELMVPLTPNMEVRATTDFHNEIDVLPTLSLNLSEGIKAYSGVGVAYQDNDAEFLVRGGVDWSLQDNLVGITYIDYNHDEVTGTVGIGYTFGGFSQPVSQIRDVQSPLERN